MKKMASKKLNTNAIIAIVVAIVGLVLVIVGLSIDWVTVKVGEMSETGVLKDLADMNDGYKAMADKSMDGYDAMVAFIYVTLAAGIIAVIAAAASVFINAKIVKGIAVGAGAVTLICAILALVFTFVFCNNELLKLGGMEMVPAIGAWLLVIGGVVCGAGSAAVAKANK